MQSENTMYKEAYIFLPHYLFFAIMEYISFIGQLPRRFYLCKLSCSSLMSKNNGNKPNYIIMLVFK